MQNKHFLNENTNTTGVREWITAGGKYEKRKSGKRRKENMKKVGGGFLYINVCHTLLMIVVYCTVLYFLVKLIEKL